MSLSDHAPRRLSLGCERIIASLDRKRLGKRKSGLTPEYVRGFKDLGYYELSADKLVTMRIHGVSWLLPE